jgi:hypothetical protein
MKKITETEKDWILSLTLEHKTMLMKTMLKEDKFGHYFQFIKVLLDAPIGKGGVSSEYIQDIFDSIVNNKNSKVNEEIK